MKSGNVVIVGRPNSGKSTLINALIGKKISIITPKPQTTRKVIWGYWQDERAQIIFWDTPGIFTKIKDLSTKKINPLPAQSLENADIVLYLVDKTRSRGDEENKILGIVRKSSKPKILVINKIDIKKSDHLHEYEFLKDEFDKTVEISAKAGKNVNLLLETIVDMLPEGGKIFNPEDMAKFPSNMTPEEFISEIVREKLFLTLRQELPYSCAVKTDEIKEKDKIFYIKVSIYTTDDRYKKMVIGKGGLAIKEIGTMSRKEIELITGKKVFLDLEVVTDPHWPEYYL
jgi:GTP-binding protein Era